MFSNLYRFKYNTRYFYDCHIYFRSILFHIDFYSMSQYSKYVMLGKVQLCINNDVCEVFGISQCEGNFRLLPYIVKSEESISSLLLISRKLSRLEISLRHFVDEALSNSTTEFFFNLLHRFISGIQLLSPKEKIIFLV